MKTWLCCLTLCLSLVCARSASASEAVRDVLPSLTVAASNVGAFYTPMAHRNGAVYTINVEPAATQPNGINLQTVVRKGVKQGNSYVWTQTVVENRTLDDAYHALGSIAMDKDGYLHIAYNMHNMPWQYAVSRKPEDISEFQFLGEPLSVGEIGIVRYDNRTPFTYLGQAAIPGSQVTYPAFFQDRNRELYVTYRFALRPKRSFPEREYSAGIARYDAKTRTWSAIGQPVALSADDADLRRPGQPRTATPFANTRGWWANDPRLWFDEKNGMHVAWSWADYGRFALGATPEPTYAYAYSPDGKNFFRSDGSAYTLPIQYAQSDTIVPGNGYNGTPNITLTRGGSGAPLIMLNPPRKPYHYVIRDPVSRRWLPPIPSPFAAQVIHVEDNGTAWAFATGPTILATRAPQMASSWRVVYKENGEWGNAKILYLREERAFLVHLTRLDNFKEPVDRRSPTRGDCRVRILRVDLDRLRI